MNVKRIRWLGIGIGLELLGLAVAGAGSASIGLGAGLENAAVGQVAHTTGMNAPASLFALKHRTAPATLLPGKTRAPVSQQVRRTFENSA